jgi:hypothetical protein
VTVTLVKKLDFKDVFVHLILLSKYLYKIETFCSENSVSGIRK